MLADLTQSNPTQAGFRVPRQIRSATLWRSTRPEITTLAAVWTRTRRARAQKPPDRLRATRRRDFRRSHRAHLEHQRGVLTAVQAAGRHGRRSPCAASQLSAVRSSDASRRRRAARPYERARTTADGASTSAASNVPSRRRRARCCWSRRTIPTGSFVVSAEARSGSQQICADRGIAIIADEVFSEYQIRAGACVDAGRVLDVRDGLVFSLGGLSKSAGLPQVKLGWIAAGGADEAIGPARERLERICVTYLSVSTPVQAAAAELLSRGAVVRAQIQARIAANYRTLADRVAAVPSCTLLVADGGWSAVLQVPSIGSEEDPASSISWATASSCTRGTSSTFRASRFSWSACCRSEARVRRWREPRAARNIQHPERAAAG